MCKYCKRLKKIKELDENYYKQVISAWKRRDMQACNLIKNLVQIQVFSLETQRALLNEANDFIHCNWVGK